MIYLIVQMAPPTRNNSRANQTQIEHAKMTDTINILAMERKALRHQHAKKDYIIARLRVRIASLEQLIPRLNKPPVPKSRPNFTNHNGGHPKPEDNNNNNNNTAPRTGSNAVPLDPRDKSTVTCYECGIKGHYSNECPKKLMKAANNTPRDKSTVTCYECGITGHYSNECPQKLMKAANNAAAPTQQQRRVAAGRQSGPSYPNNRNGRFYRVNAAEAQEAPNVILGMFSC